jgi:hypothetical protein
MADVYHLRRSGYVSKRLWVLFEREVRHTLTGPVFRREWEVVSVEFSHDCEFLRYIDELMRSYRPRRLARKSAAGTAKP